MDATGTKDSYQETLQGRRSGHSQGRQWEKRGWGDLLGDRSAKPSQGPSTVLPSAAEVQAPQRLDLVHGSSPWPVARRDTASNQYCDAPLPDAPDFRPARSNSIPRHHSAADLWNSCKWGSETREVRPLDISTSIRMRSMPRGSSRRKRKEAACGTRNGIESSEPKRDGTQEAYKPWKTTTKWAKPRQGRWVIGTHGGPKAVGSALRVMSDDRGSQRSPRATHRSGQGKDRGGQWSLAQATSATSYHHGTQEGSTPSRLAGIKSYTTRIKAKPWEKSWRTRVRNVPSAKERCSRTSTQWERRRTSLGKATQPTDIRKDTKQIFRDNVQDRFRNSTTRIKAKPWGKSWMTQVCNVPSAKERCSRTSTQRKRVGPPVKSRTHAFRGLPGAQLHAPINHPGYEEQPERVCSDLVRPHQRIRLSAAHNNLGCSEQQGPVPGNRRQDCRDISRQQDNIPNPSRANIGRSHQSSSSQLKRGMQF